MTTALFLAVLLSCISKMTAAPPKLVGSAEGYTDVADYFRLLKCNIEGEGLSYEWYHNGVKIEPTTTKFFMTDSRIIASRPKVTEDYQGKYQCKASNKDGTLLGPEMVVAFTIVGRFKQSDDQTQTIDVTVGKELQLKCPPRTLSQNIYYHWGGRRGVTGAWFIPQKKHYMIMEDGSLLFANVKDQDIEYFNVEKNGVSCSIESKGETKRISFSQRTLLLEVGEKNTVPFGPTIKTALVDREVAKGTKFIVLRCGAVGLPTPDYSWTFTGIDGIEKPVIDDEDGYELTDFNHVLTIKSIETKHDGWYKCLVESSYGGKKHTDEKKARISVKGKPRWVRGGQLSDVSPTKGDTFEWSCKAYAKPDPSYTWLFNGKKVSNKTDELSIDDGTITFKKVSKKNEGLYQCIAENRFGQISSSGVLKPIPARCNISNINLMFLVDGSGSVPRKTFEEFKTFMKLLVGRVAVGPRGTHVGALQYSSKERTGLEFALGQYKTLDAVQNSISGIIYHYGAHTFGGYAMKMANKIMSTYSDIMARYIGRVAKNVIVLLMDDGLWDEKLAREQSKDLREKGTQIIILDTRKIMHELADLGLEFTTEKLEENVDKVAQEICQ